MNITLIKEQLFSSLKSVKSIVLILLLSLISYAVANNFTQLPLLASGTNTLSVSDIIFALLSVLGVFFTLQMFGGNLTREIETQSIRYVLPYVKRYEIILAKIIAYQLFWLIILAISLLILSISRHEFFFPVTDLISMFGFFLYINAIALLTSVVVKKEKSSTFIGIVISILIVFIGIWSILSHNIMLKALSWLLPYRYMTFNWDIIVLFVLSFILIIASIVIFNKKEL